MAATECTVSGNLYDIGVNAAAVKLTFQLTADYDAQYGEGVIVNRREVVTVTSGTFSVSLWPNVEGYSGTRYAVTAVTYTDDNFDVALDVLDLGKIEVPNSGTVDLADILQVQVKDAGPLTLYIGDSFAQTLQYTHANKSRQSLAGVTVSSFVVIDGVATALTVAIISEAAGQVELSWTSAETGALTAGVWPWYTVFEHSGGGVYTVPHHDLTIKERGQ